MHLLLTDVLACPRCGPDFGLILRADEMSDRRVRQGVLGCANCRDNFPIRDGFVDLRPPPRTEVRAVDAVPGGGAQEDADRLRALLGLIRGSGTVALVGEPAAHARALAAQVEGLQVAAFSDAMAGADDFETVSRGRIGSSLPFFTQRLRGVALDGKLEPELLEEAARVVGRGGRVVVSDARPETSERLVAAGLTALVEEAQTVVAARN